MGEGAARVLCRCYSHLGRMALTNFHRNTQYSFLYSGMRIFHMLCSLFLL